jgi:hypothetical protein
LDSDDDNDDEDDESDLVVLASVTVSDSTFDVPLIDFTIELGKNDTFSSRFSNLIVSSVPIGVLV